MSGVDRAGPTKPTNGLDILHLDMDAFFASVEVLANPSLAGKPVVVGGAGARGVVASASYEARVFGVRSAMPMSEARRRCPALVVVAGHHDEYGRVSAALLEILTAVTSAVEPISIDEAFLDVSGAHGLFGSSEEIATMLRAQVHEQLSLSCAVGVGRSKLIAKLASKAAKPEASRGGPKAGRGVLVVTEAEELDFLYRHDIRAIPGIGPKTAERLKRLGVSTVRDLAVLERDQLVRLVGKAQGEVLGDLAIGRDHRRVVADRPNRSIGREETFETDDRDPASLERRARSLAEAAANRCRSAGFAARTVSLKVRFADFSLMTRARSPGYSVRSRTEIAAIACELLLGIEVERGVRLLGVSLSGLEPLELGSGRQLHLFGEATQEDPAMAADVNHSSAASSARREEIDSVTDEIHRRFGDAAIAPASTVRPVGRRE